MGFDNLTSEHLAIIVLGMGAVFVLLIFISFVVSLLKYVPALLGRKEAAGVKEQASNGGDTAIASGGGVQVSADMDNKDNRTLIAVITAAIYASKNQGQENIASRDEYVVRSIRRI